MKWVRNCSKDTIQKKMVTFFSATNIATEGFKPGLSETEVAPSTLSLSTIPLDHSEGRKTCISDETRRMACDSEMVYCRSHDSCDFWGKAINSSPVDTEKTRRFLCWRPSSSFTGLKKKKLIITLTCMVRRMDLTHQVAPKLRGKYHEARTWGRQC